MRRYASRTSVPIDRSRAEIEGLLKRYRADEFAYGWTKDGAAAIGFVMEGRPVKLRVPIPDRKDPEIRMTPGGKLRTENQIEEAWDQEMRRRWRAMALVVKAKLEAVESGIADFSDEFLAYTVLPSGRLIGEELKPRLDHIAKTGQMPTLGLTDQRPKAIALEEGGREADDGSGGGRT